MRRRLVLLLFVTSVALAACGGESADPGTTSPPGETTTAATPATTTSTTTPSTTTPSITTTTSTTTTPPSPPPTSPPSFPDILRPNGIGAVDFGMLEQDALDTLKAVLGEPDDVEELPPGDINYMVVEQGRQYIWADLDLHLIFTDWNGDWVSPAAIPVHLSDWEVRGPGLSTSAGIGAGSTTAQLRAAYPDARFGINEFAPVFYVETEWGVLMGSVDWPTYDEFDAALQAALAEHGFPTSGEPGAGTGQALVDFIDGLADPGDVLTALGLPPDDIPVGNWMHAGAGPLCC